MIDTHAVGLAVLTASVTLQLLAATLALRLIPLTSRRLPWACIAAAFFMMAGRRAIPLWHGLSSTSGPRPIDLESEVLGLAIAIAGVVLISLK